MLSKAKGQILRVAAALHVLFNINTPLAIPTNISDTAIKAAVNLVEVCIQHAAFLAGRGDVEETIQGLLEGKFTSVNVLVHHDNTDTRLLNISECIAHVLDRTPRTIFMYSQLLICVHPDLTLHRFGTSYATHTYQ